MGRELQTRLTLPFVVPPHTSIELENRVQASEYVRACFMAMIVGPDDRERAVLGMSYRASGANIP